MTNEQLELALDFVENTGATIFLTGRAGTGKTTFLHNLRILSPKRMIVVAPTGVAAINAKGSTIHSFFQLPFGLFLPGIHRSEKEVRKYSKTKIKIIKSMELLVIDEISMVRADLLDAIDDVLRRFRNKNKPFGGVQLLLIGDLQQLSPVVRNEEWELLSQYYQSPYFFDSLALKENKYRVIELQHIYRQTDRDFIDLLAKVRDNALDDKSLALLNSRYIENFKPDKSEGYITLASHNYITQAINDTNLKELQEEEYTFKAQKTGTFEDYPVDYELVLKKGAQVMFARNDSTPEKRFVNGTIGEVTAIGAKNIEVTIVGDNRVVEVVPEIWENIKYSIDTQTNEITEVVDGTFTQYPLKTAWAITIHKSQGLTFDRVIIDAAKSFSHGQVYVALSRCRTLEGVVLCTPLRFSSIKSDQTVLTYSKEVESHPITDYELSDDKRSYYHQLLAELFDFGPMMGQITYLRRQLAENLITTYPKLVERWGVEMNHYRTDIEDVAIRFRMQIDRLMLNSIYWEDENLADRVQKGAAYFTNKCKEIIEPLIESLVIDIDNKEIAKIIKDAGVRLKESYIVKMATLESVNQDRFSVKGYLAAKAKAVIAQMDDDKKTKKPKSSRAAVDFGDDVDSAAAIEDIEDSELFDVLKRWRREKAAEIDKPAFVVAHQKVLIGIAQDKPTDYKELLAIKGVGKAFVGKYGDEIFEILDGYR